MGSRSRPAPPAALNGGFRINWTSLHAYGFDVGRGDLNGTLAKGVCGFNPISATFGGGKVNVQPTLHLDVEPGFLTFAKGKIVEARG